MGLKDVDKIVANEVARDANRAEASKAISREGLQWKQRIEELSKGVKPGTNKPANVAGHVGIKYQSDNPFHKDLLNSALKGGQAMKAVIHEGGVLSFPKETIFNSDSGFSNKFEVAADTSGGEKHYKGEAAKVAKRPSEKDSKSPSARPAGPVAAVGQALNVDQQRSAKRREMELKQQEISERIRRQREGK